MKRLFLLLALTLFIFASCTKTPVASFSVSTTSAYVDEPISFSNQSIDAVSYEWNFGDGSTSSEMNPTHTYTTGGTYTVTLTAYSKNMKKMATYSENITIKNKLILKNTTFTTIYAEIDGQDITIDPDETVTVYDVSNYCSLNAYTYEVDNYGNILGEIMVWDETLNLETGYSYNLYIGSDYFYLIINNCSSEWIDYVRINTDMGSAEKEYYISLSPSCSDYYMGYYQAYYSSDVYIEFEDDSYCYFDDLGLSWTDNQGIRLTCYDKNGKKIQTKSNQTDDNFIKLYPTKNKTL